MKKLLFALMIAILSISIVGCMDVTGDPNGESKESQTSQTSTVESKEESYEQSQESSSGPNVNESGSEEESQSNEESNSEPNSEVESESASEDESETEEESESEVEVVYTVTISYKTSYNAQVTTRTITVAEGEEVTIELPTISVDSNADYAFTGWKILETGATYGKDVTSITITVTQDITIQTTYTKQYTGNY